MTTRLAEIAERLSKATPGEWHAGHLADDAHPCNCKAVVSDSGLMGGICRVLYDNGLAISEGGNDSPALEEAKANLRFIAHAHQDIPYLLADNTRLVSQLTAAQARSREDAEIMRAAADTLERAQSYDYRSDDGDTLMCLLCNGHGPDAKTSDHTPDCFVTKLRARADELEGRTDG